MKTSNTDQKAAKAMAEIYLELLLTCLKTQSHDKTIDCSPHYKQFELQLQKYIAAKKSQG